MLVRIICGDTGKVIFVRVGKKKNSSDVSLSITADRTYVIDRSRDDSDLESEAQKQTRRVAR
jgi:hypothetical protein